MWQERGWEAAEAARVRAAGWRFRSGGDRARLLGVKGVVRQVNLGKARHGEASQNSRLRADGVKARRAGNWKRVSGRGLGCVRVL